MNFIVSEKELILHNNLVWKFNRDEKYPFSLYRDTSNVVLRDKRTVYQFLDTLDMEKPDIYRINNLTQFTPNVITLPKKKELEKELEPKFLQDKMTRVYESMTFYSLFFPHQDKKQGKIHLYFFKITKDNLMENISIQNMLDDEISFIFSMFGDALSLALDKAIDKLYQTYCEEHPIEKVSFLQSVLGKKAKKNPASDLPRNYFLSKINLTEIVPEIVAKYIYNQQNKEERMKFLSNVLMVIDLTDSED